MAYEEKSKTLSVSHRLSLDERQNLWMTGVEEVESFDEEEISIQTVKGRLYVRGDGLKVDKLEKNTGELTVSGQVSSLEYEDTGFRQGLWSRLFK